MTVPETSPENAPESPLPSGLDRVLADPPAEWRSARIGLLCNQAAVTQDLRLASEALAAEFPGALRALFGPQHGLWSAAQDNMVETSHGHDPRLGVPVWSLYGETRAPDPAWLAELDLVLVDLPDVGCRVYTYIWTVVNLLEVASELGLRVVVLDRPNPIGPRVEGPDLDPDYQSFVGGHPIPLRHGCTLGELARLVARELGLPVELEIVSASATDAPGASLAQRVWVPPSPNLPRREGALLYPGTVLFEGSNLSEGRGTTTPFEIVGAPWIEPFRWRDALRERLPRDCGVQLRPLRFEPTFQKHAGLDCGGLFLHVTDPARLAAVGLAAQLFATLKSLWPAELRWKEPPYEYETERLPIDILAGGPAWRTAVDSGALPESGCDLAGWRERRERSGSSV